MKHKWRVLAGSENKQVKFVPKCSNTDPNNFRRWRVNTFKECTELGALVPVHPAVRINLGYGGNMSNQPRTCKLTINQAYLSELRLDFTIHRKDKFSAYSHF
jgi:hypothetical protein